MIRQTVLALLATACLGAALPQEPTATLIRGAHVFEGDGKLARVRDVLIDGERIAEIGRRIDAPDGARIIDGTGLTLIPGLHDLHIHTRRQAFESAEKLEQAYSPYLAAGVTSVNEFSVSGEMIAGIRAIEGPRVPHLELAIRFGVPHGHGTESEFTSTITTQVTSPAEAHAAMSHALIRKPDVIKVFADGWRYGDPERPDRPSIDLPTLTAIVQDAHRAGIPVVTHTVTLEGAKLAARAGVDAVVHGVGDALVDKELIRLMKRADTAYVPTMVVYEPQNNRRFPAGEWRMMRPGDRAREQARLSKPMQVSPAYEQRRWDILRQNLRLLKDGGVRIGVGTDTGIGGVYPGAATLREMGIYVDLGFSPAEALAAATSVSARVMHKERIDGRIARGYRADLVLTGGRPDLRHADLYDVRRVWVSGREVPLAREAQLRESDTGE